MKKILSLLFLLGFMGSALADEEFYGKVESMPENSFEGEWVIDGKSYQVTSETEIDEEDGNAKVGACVEVEIKGEVQRDYRVDEIEVVKYSFLCGLYKLNLFD